MDIVSIPRNANGFNALQSLVNTLLALKGLEWGILPLAITNLLVNQTTFKPLFDNCANKATVSKGNRSLRDNYISEIYYLQLEKVFTKYLLNNDAISVADKLALGIHPQAHNNAPIPNPTTAPIMLISNGQPLQMNVVIRNAATGKIGKPKGVGFCEIWYKIDDPAPVNLDEAVKKVNIKKSGEVLTFPLTDKGKKIYFFARWITKKGGAGPFTDLFSGIIV